MYVCDYLHTCMPHTGTCRAQKCTNTGAKHTVCVLSPAFGFISIYNLCRIGVYCRRRKAPEDGDNKGLPDDWISRTRRLQRHRSVRVIRRRAHLCSCPRPTTYSSESLPLSPSGPAPRSAHKRLARRRGLDSSPALVASPQTISSRAAPPANFYAPEEEGWNEGRNNRGEGIRDGCATRSLKLTRWPLCAVC